MSIRTFKCFWCSKVFQRKHRNDRENRFCSIKCAAQHRDQNCESLHKKSYKCSVCNVIFGVERRGATKNRMRTGTMSCSNKCAAIKRRQSKTKVLLSKFCALCNCSFFMKSAIKDGPKGWQEKKFCSAQCMSKCHPLNPSIKERLLNRAIKTTQKNGCWLFRKVLGGKEWARGRAYAPFLLEKFIKVEAHRASYLLHKGPIPDGMVVRHTCDIGMCINPSHLLLGTVSDNNKDRNERYRTKDGRPNDIALSWGKIRDVRAWIENGATDVAIGKILSVVPATVTAMRRKSHWSYRPAYASHPELQPKP